MKTYERYSKTDRPTQKEEINRVVDDNAADDKSSAFILESTDEPYIGARAILELGNEIDNFAARRIPNADAMESVTQLFPGIESAPAVVFTEGSVTYYIQENRVGRRARPRLRESCLLTPFGHGGGANSRNQVSVVSTYYFVSGGLNLYQLQFTTSWAGVAVH